MKSFLCIVPLLSLLLLSITPEEVLGKTLKCYYPGMHNEYVKEDCEGNDVVCITAVKKDNPEEAVYKTCGERNAAISECEKWANWENGICKEPCTTDLCNDEFYPFAEPEAGMYGW